MRFHRRILWIVGLALGCILLVIAVHTVADFRAQAQIFSQLHKIDPVYEFATLQRNIFINNLVTGLIIMGLAAVTLAMIWVLVIWPLEDITDHKQAEEALRQSERFNERITGTVPLIIYIFDIIEQRNIYSNRQMLNLLGYTPHEIQELGSDFLPKLLHPEEVVQLQELFQRWDTATDRDVIETEYRMKHADGGWRWFLGSDTVFKRTPDGRVKQIIGVAQDITERKQTEQALQESGQRFRTLVEGSIQGILVHRDTKPLFANPAYAKILGYDSPAEILALESVMPLIAPYEQERLLGYHAVRVKGESAPIRYEYDAVCKDGSIVTLHQLVTMISWDGKPAVMGAIVDITERKRTEEALRQSEASLAEAQRIAHLGNWERNTQTGELRWSDEVYRIFGVAPQEFGATYEAFLSYVHPDDRNDVKQSLADASSGGKSYNIEHRIIRPDGTTGVVHERAEIILDALGEPTRIIGTVLDITERKLVEKALQESEKKLRLILDNVVDGIITIDEWGIINRFNHAAEKMFGYAAAEVVGQNVKLLMPEPYRSDHNDYLANYRRTGQSIIIGGSREVSGQHKDGLVFPVDLAVSEYFLNERRIFIGIVRDITERKRREKALQESEARYKTLFNAVPVPIYTKDRNGCYTSSNLKNLEYWPQSPVGYTDAELLPAEIASKLRSIDLQVMETGHELMAEELFPTSSGLRYMFSHKVPLRNADGAVIGILGGSIDITERKQAETALHKHQDELHQRNRELTLLNQIIAASVANPEPNDILAMACRELALAFDIPQAAAILLDANQSTATIVAEYRAEERSFPMNEVIPIKDKGVAHHLFNHKMPLVIDYAQSNPCLASVHDLLRQYGADSLLIVPLIIEGHAMGALWLGATAPHIFSSEEINLAWRVADQITGSLARAELSRARRLLSTAIEQSTESIIITDTTGTIIYVNPAFEKLNGYSSSEVIGRTPALLKSGWQGSAVYEELWTTIKAGRVWHNRLVNKRRNDTYYTVDAIITPVRNEMGMVVNYVALQRDITHEVRLEEQLRQSQKMEAIGRLAGGVAHDFNNLLTIIIGNTEILLSSFLDSNDPRRKDIQQISNAGERAATLTRQLLAFSRQEATQLQVLSLNRIVTGVTNMLERLIGEHITLITRLAPDLGQVKVDPGQIEQVIVNLAVNARDVMRQGGQLTIETANVELTEVVAKIYRLTPGSYVMLAVTDTGCGMDTETIDRIFEPFFTTKGQNKGTGLGLAIVYAIVEQHGGCIQVESVLEQGTTFKIYLTRVEPSVETAPPSRPSFSALKGLETILLVEDEDDVRQVARKFLEKGGYTVLEADCAEEALQLGRQHRGQIDLLLTDVLMPGMNGRKLAEQLVQLYPDLKVLFISGYAEDIFDQHPMFNPKAILLDKPFSSDVLIHKVRQVLDSAK